MTAIRHIPLICLCTAFSLSGPMATAEQPAGAPTLKIAVFNFELEDLSAASVLLGLDTTSLSSLEKAGQMARKTLAKSHRYVVIDPNRAKAQVTYKAFKDCDGCEIQDAAALGADQSLIGIVRRVSQTDYYVVVLIRDAHTGKVLAEEAANFAGGEDGWASGVRMLIDHQVLPVLAAHTSVEPTCRLADVNPVSGNAECVDPRGAPVDPPPPRDHRT